jgi:hypothetical protein
LKRNQGVLKFQKVRENSQLQVVYLEKKSSLSPIPKKDCTKLEETFCSLGLADPQEQKRGKELASKVLKRLNNWPTKVQDYWIA